MYHSGVGGGIYPGGGGLLTTLQGEIGHLKIVRIFLTQPFIYIFFRRNPGSGVPCINITGCLYSKRLVLNIDPIDLFS